MVGVGMPRTQVTSTGGSMAENPAGPGPQGKPSLVANPISYTGTLLAVAALATIIFILLIEFVGGRETPYIGVLLYLALPTLLVLGLVLVPVGMLRVRKRLRSPEAIAAGL